MLCMHLQKFKTILIFVTQKHISGSRRVTNEQVHYWVPLKLLKIQLLQ